MEIEKSVVFVTGASGGIGAALVDALRQAGAAEIIAAGREALDVTDAAAVRRVTAGCASRVDIVINSAGVNANRRLLTDGFETAARQELEVNYFGLLNVAAAFAPARRRRIRSPRRCARS